MAWWSKLIGLGLGLGLGLGGCSKAAPAADASAPAAAAPPAAKEGVEKLLKDYSDALLRKDHRAMCDLLVEDFAAQPDDGGAPQPKAAACAALAEGFKELRVITIEQTIESVTPSSPTAAKGIYRQKLKVGISQPGKTELISRVANRKEQTFRYERGRWRIASGSRTLDQVQSVLDGGLPAGGGN